MVAVHNPGRLQRVHIARTTCTAGLQKLLAALGRPSATGRNGTTSLALSRPRAVRMREPHTNRLQQCAIRVRQLSRTGPAGAARLVLIGVQSKGTHEPTKPSPAWHD